MKSQGLNFSMDFVCPVPWDSMNPTDGGRHCSLCDKAVIDLTDCGKEEMLALISGEREGEFCGRVRGDQVKIPFEQQLAYLAGRPFRAAEIFGVALLMTFGVGTAQAQTSFQDEVQSHFAELAGSCIDPRDIRLGGAIVPIEFLRDSTSLDTTETVDSSRFIRLRRVRKGKFKEVKVVSRPIYFSKNSYLVGEKEDQIVREIADSIRKYPENIVRIYGYGDQEDGEVNVSSLSRFRAEAMRDRLRAFGIGNVIEIVGLGQPDPEESGQEKGIPLSRKAEAVILIPEN